jgi:parallel beta-helix repeat protein
MRNIILPIIFAILLTSSQVWAYTVCSSGCDYTLTTFNALTGDRSNDTFYFTENLTATVAPQIYGTNGNGVILDFWEGGTCTPVADLGCTGPVTVDINSSTTCIQLSETSDYITIQDAKLIDCETGVSTAGADNITLKDSYIYNIYSFGFAHSQNSTGNVVGGEFGDGNYFLKNGFQGGSAGEAIGLWAGDIDITHNLIDGTDSYESDGIVCGINNSENILVDRNTIRYTNYGAQDGDGIDFKGCGEFVISNNDIHSQRRGIVVQDGSYNGVVKNNRIWNHVGKGININSRAAGLQTTKNITVEGNVIYYSGGSGIGLEQNTPYFNEDIYIFNNTIAYTSFGDPGYAYNSCIAGGVSNGDLEIEGNIFYNCRWNNDSFKGKSLQIANSSAQLDVLENNLYYYSGGAATLNIGGFPGTQYTINTNPSTDACDQAGYECDRLEGNPDFVSPGSPNYDYTLQAGSPAVNGSNGTAILLDPATTNFAAIPPVVNTVAGADEIGAYAEPSTRITQSGSSSFR